MTKFSLLAELLYIFFCYFWGLMGSLGRVAVTVKSARSGRRHALINPGLVPSPALGDRLHQSTNQKLVQI